MVELEQLVELEHGVELKQGVELEQDMELEQGGLSPRFDAFPTRHTAWAVRIWPGPCPHEWVPGARLPFSLSFDRFERFDTRHSTRTRHRSFANVSQQVVSSVGVLAEVVSRHCRRALA